MTDRLEIYKCEICGNIVQVLHSGDGELVCCGKTMTLLKPHTREEEKQEKHVPVFKENEILVGSEPHPMLEEHHIEFIQAMSEDKKYTLTKFLDINEEPKMAICEQTQLTKATEYCNIHGLWIGHK